MQLSEPQKAIVNSNKQINLFLAGQGSGKTHIAGLISAFYVSNFPASIGIVAANTYDQLNRSTMYRIRQVWKDYFNMTEHRESNSKGNYVVGRMPPVHFNTENHNFDNYNNIISFENGALIFIGSMDNYKSLDGMEVTWAVLDETKDTKEEAVKEVIIGRLRRRSLWLSSEGVINDFEDGESYNPLYIITSPAKVKWLNEWFELDLFEDQIKRTIFDKNDFFCNDHKNKRVVISSTYHNSDNLPSNYLENQTENLTPELQEMLIFGSPFSRSGGEFYKQFDRSKHIGSHKYSPALPLHISLDENVHPYLTCTIWQITGKRAVQVDEICAESPNNTVDGVCSEFTQRYKNHDAGLFIYGDRTSVKEDTKLQKGTNFFTMFRGKLAQYKPVLKLPSRNPPVVLRGQFINMVFYNNFQGLSFSIDENCKNTIADYTYLKEDADGTKSKKKVRDPDTGVSYEKYGHTSDANDYLICEVFKQQLNLYIRPHSTVEKIAVGVNPINRKTHY